MMEAFSAANLQRIWNQYGLGHIDKIDQPGHGMVNKVFIINETHIIRFDVLINDGESRYYKEALAYQRARAAGVPAPEVIAVDTSKTLLPHDYLLMTRLPGRPMIECWPDLSPEQQAQLAYQCGQCLARLHSISFDHFGNYAGQNGAFDSCYEATSNYVERYIADALKNSLLDSDTLDQIKAVLVRHKSVFNAVMPGHLVHRDFQFSNILQVDGQVTAVLDFEWSLCGDPSYDFILREQWVDECPGSREQVYAGYTSLRPLADDHELRVRLYSLFFALECVVDAFTPVDEAAAKAQVRALLDTFKR